MNEVCILNASAVQARLLRLGYEILEQNYELEQLVFIGIDDRGYWLAEHLALLLKSRCAIPINLLAFNQIKSLDSAKTNADLSLTNRVVFLVDDVLYTGRTLLSALTKIQQLEPAAVRSVVLIDRGHRLWPVAADHVGLVLATTLQEFVSVRFDPLTRTFSAYLS
jgi:pyrimidine operon attenuation protein/uracil phosphoribosyltransferase